MGSEKVLLERRMRQSRRRYVATEVLQKQRMNYFKWKN